MVKAKSVKFKKVKQTFTSLLIASLQCPPGKNQSLHWDSETPNFGLRITASGNKAYIFEASLHNKSIRITIGNIQDHSLEEARSQATKLRSLIRMGVDPRKIEQKQASQWRSTEALSNKKQLKNETVQYAWLNYIQAHYEPEHGINTWSKRRYEQHNQLIETALAPLANVKMSGLSVAHIQAWGENLKDIPESHLRFNAKLCLNFLRWCHSHDIYQYAIPSSMLVKMEEWVQSLNHVEPRYLSPEQLPAWYQAVDSIDDITVKAYLKILLLTGRNQKVLLALKWQDIDTKQRTINIRDKHMPISKAMLALFNTLPQIDEWVFSELVKPSPRQLSATQWHQQVCTDNQINLSLDDLITSYTLYSEWVETPSGIIGQLQNIDIKGITTQHFVKRPLPILAIWQQKIEDWIFTKIRTTNYL